jgi:plasmid stabilization system protein ParE
MDEPRPATTKFHCRLRTAFYNLGEECGVTGFEAAGVLSYLAAEVNADNLAAEGLLARGPGLQEREPAEPEPATSTPEDTPLSRWLDQNLLPVLDERSAEEIVGYGEDGLCGEGAGTMGSRPTSAAAYIAELEEQCRTKDRDIQDLQHLHAQNTEGWQEENAKLTAKVAELEATVAELQSDYRTLDCGHERMTKKATELSERVAGLAAENDQPVSAAAYIAELEVKVEKLQDELVNLAAERFETVSALEEESISLEVKVERLEADYRTLDRSYECMTRKAAELGERVAALAKENGRLTAELEKAEVKCRDLEQERGARIDETDELYSKLEKAEAKVKELEAKHESMINALRGGMLGFASG